jgi:hypothetical protein
LQASIIGGVCCWLWQDSNAVMGKFFISFFSFFLNHSIISYFKIPKTIFKKEQKIRNYYIFFFKFFEADLVEL